MAENVSVVTPVVEEQKVEAPAAPAPVVAKAKPAVKTALGPGARAEAEK